MQTGMTPQPDSFLLAEIAHWFVVLPLGRSRRHCTFRSEAPWTVRQEHRTGTILSALVAA